MIINIDDDDDDDDDNKYDDDDGDEKVPLNRGIQLCL
jgi:hypothetical protein